jgi:hypothetical protein
MLASQPRPRVALRLPWASPTFAIRAETTTQVVANQQNRFKSLSPSPFETGRREIRAFFNQKQAKRGFSTKIIFLATANSESRVSSAA